MRRGTNIVQNDFSGGLHTTGANTEISTNEASDLSNIIIGPDGDYIRTKGGNTLFNSSAMNSGANVQSLSYLKLINGNDFLVSICGDKIFKADNLDGTMDDVTGAVSITAGQNNIWTFLTFNNVHIGFGGPSTGPDTPIQYTGSGNAAALSGTPPSAYGAIQANNRVFAFRTAASPSIVQWCILGNAQDWTGTGSGSQTISTSDNDSVSAMALMSDSLALVFKQNSVHKLLINTLVSGAFPTFPLFRGFGCAGKHAAVVANGLCFFITNKGKMKITDGERIVGDEELPQLSFVDDLWNTMNSTRYEYIQGKYVFGQDYEHIVWLMTSTAAGTTHDTLLIWDIRNKCWLRNKTGYKMNVICTTQTGAIYTGNYAGQIYLQDVDSVTTEASESSANIYSYWTTGWNPYGNLQPVKSVTETNISYLTQTIGNIDFSWGYNFNSFQRTISIDQRSSGGIIGVFVIGTGVLGGPSDKISKINTLGNGQVFQYRIGCNTSKMKINNLNFLVNGIHSSSKAA